jgi:hypothetical protein
MQTQNTQMILGAHHPYLGAIKVHYFATTGQLCEVKVAESADLVVIEIHPVLLVFRSAQRGSSLRVLLWRHAHVYIARWTKPCLWVCSGNCPSLDQDWIDPA